MPLLFNALGTTMALDSALKPVPGSVPYYVHPQDVVHIHGVCKLQEMLIVVRALFSNRPRLIGL